MEVIGRGFLATHAVKYFGERHPDVTLIAAGVSTVFLTDADTFGREADLVYGILRRCRAQGRTAILLSTASAGMYGAPESPGTEDGPVFPLTPYGRHKLGLEAVCAASGSRYLTLRLAHIVGPGQKPHQLLPSLVRQLRSGQVRIHRGATRDLVGVRDMLGLLDILLGRGVRGQVVNIATGRPESIELIVDRLEARLGLRAERELVDMPDRHAVVSTAKLRTLVPEFDRFGFGEGYLADLIDQHLDVPMSAVP